MEQKNLQTINLTNQVLTKKQHFKIVEIHFINSQVQNHQNHLPNKQFAGNPINSCSK